MNTRISTYRSMVFAGLFAAQAAGALAAPAVPVTLQLSWRAQGENGGYYDAQVRGYYAACGIDMTIRQGGAGIDTKQLLTAGAVDAALVSQNDGVMRMNAAGFRARAVMAVFQRFPGVLDVHPDSGIQSIGDMRGHPILLAAGNRDTFWPFLKEKFGLTDAQLHNFSGQYAPFIADRSVVAQDLITNGPFVIKRQAGIDVKSFFLSDSGYNPYSSIVAVSQKMIDTKPQVVQCLVDATRKGWDDYLKNPKPGFDAIRQVAPENSPELLNYTFDAMKRYRIVETDDTAQSGIGAMTDARWKSHFDMLVANHLFPANFDYRSAYTLQFLGKHPG
jgi:NitT/TauT family transport system substrate-binding protein